MKYLDLTFADPAHNLACDEALLEWVETGQLKEEVLRVWEPARYFVVLGHGNSIRNEVNFFACEQDQLTIVRRMSGGGAVLQGPGCFNYSLVLSSGAHRFRTVGESFRYVLERHKKMIQALTGFEIALEGISDLAIGARKFSGNAQYRKSRSVLIHGTFLLEFDLAMIGRYLLVPAKQPTYRQNRSHLEFLITLPVKSAALRDRLKEIWNADEALNQIPAGRINGLVQQRYGRKEWSEKF